MAKVCFTDLRDALKGVVSKEDLEGLVKNIKEKADFRMRENMEPKAQALGKTIDELIEDAKQQHDLKKMHAYLNIIRHKELSPMINAFKERGLGLVAAVDGTARNIKDGRFSANALGKAMSARLKSQFLKELKDSPHKDLLSMLNRGDHELEIAQEIHQRGSSKNPQIRAIADAWEKVTGRGVKMLNSVGAYIGKDEEKGYLGRMNHNTDMVSQPYSSTAKNIAERARALKEGKNVNEHMRELAYNNWKNFILPHLDSAKTFEGADPEKFLRGAWEGIVSGVHKTPYVATEEGQTFKVGRVGNMADRLSRQRVFIWKDGASEMQYIQRYGNGTLLTTMMKTLERSGQDYGLMRRFGPNPMAMFQRLRKETTEANRLEPKLNKRANLAENTLRAKVMGDKAESRIFANVAGSARMVKALHDMASVVFWAIADNAFRVSKMQELGVPVWKTYGQIVKDMMDPASIQERKELADITGVWAQTTMGSMHARMSAVDTPKNKLGHLSELYFKYTGLQYLDNVNRTGTAAAISRMLSGYRGDAFENLHEGLKRNMTAYGLGEKEWDLIRGSAQLINGKKFITPDGMWTANKSLIDKYAGKETTHEEASKIRQEMDNRLSTFFMDQVDDSQFQPRESTRRMGLGNTQPGTVSGEAARTFMLFKLWGIEATRRSLGRIIYGNGHDGLADAIMNGSAARYQLMTFGANAIMLSYIAKSAKAAANNQTPPSMDNWATAKDVILGSGLFGYYGSLVSNDYSFGRGLIETLGGPMTGTVNDVGMVMTDILNGNNPMKSTAKLLADNTPFLNAWYLKSALDFTFLNAWHEQNNPGMFWKKEQKMLAQTGQQYIFNPLAFSH